MVEKLCTPSDEEHEVHKRLQLRELAALNGTLKDLEACFVCGEAGHDAEHCPKRVSKLRMAAGRLVSSSWCLRLLSAHVMVAVIVHAAQYPAELLYLCPRVLQHSFYAAIQCDR